MSPLNNFIGDVGSGKTIFLTKLLLDAIEKSNRQVHANYHLFKNLSDKIKVMKLIEEHKPIPSNFLMNNFTILEPEMLVSLQSSEVGIDEAYSWLESRTSGKDMNKFLSYILFQSRKKDLEMYTTDQILETIDVRFRLLANREIICENTGKGFKYTIKKLSRWHNYRPRRLFMPNSLAETYFDRYNTYELINPIDENMIFNITQNKEELLEEIDEIVTKLLKDAPANKYTKGMLEAWCLKNKKPKKMAERIYNQMKLKALKISL